MDSEVHEFEYRLQAWGVLFLGGAMGMFCLAFAFLANTTGTGSGSARASLFYWGLSALFCLGAGIVGWLALRQKKAGRVIRISGDSLSLPKRPLSSKIVTVPLDDLIRVEMVSNRGISFISVRHRGGAMAIPELQVATKDEFKRIHELLSAHCPE